MQRINGNKIEIFRETKVEDIREALKDFRGQIKIYVRQLAGDLIELILSHLVKHPSTEISFNLSKQNQSSVFQEVMNIFQRLFEGDEVKYVRAYDSFFQTKNQIKNAKILNTYLMLSLAEEDDAVSEPSIKRRKIDESQSKAEETRHQIYSLLLINVLDLDSLREETISLLLSSLTHLQKKSLQLFIKQMPKNESELNSTKKNNQHAQLGFTLQTSSNPGAISQASSSSTTTTTTTTTSRQTTTSFTPSSTTMLPISSSLVKTAPLPTIPPTTFPAGLVVPAFSHVSGLSVQNLSSFIPREKSLKKLNFPTGLTLEKQSNGRFLNPHFISASNPKDQSRQFIDDRKRQGNRQLILIVIKEFEMMPDKKKVQFFLEENEKRMNYAKLSKSFYDLWNGNADVRSEIIEPKRIQKKCFLIFQEEVESPEQIVEWIKGRSNKKSAPVPIGDFFNLKYIDWKNSRCNGKNITIYLLDGSSLTPMQVNQYFKRNCRSKESGGVKALLEKVSEAKDCVQITFKQPCTSVENAIELLGKQVMGGNYEVKKMLELLVVRLTVAPAIAKQSGRSENFLKEAQAPILTEDVVEVGVIDQDLQALLSHDKHSRDDGVEESNSPIIFGSPLILPSPSTSNTPEEDSLNNFDGEEIEELVEEQNAEEGQDKTVTEKAEVNPNRAVTGIGKFSVFNQGANVNSQNNQNAENYSKSPNSHESVNEKGF